MSLVSLMVRDITILVPGTRTDAYGDTQLDWTTPVGTLTQGWLAQQTSTEVVDGRNTTVSELVLTLPAGTAINARDRVRVDGVVYEIIDEPLAAWTPRGEHHIEAKLRLVTG